MKVLASILFTIWIAAVAANGLLFVYVEWLYIRESFLNLFLPWVHIQVVLTLFTIPLFWVLAAIIVVSYVLAQVVERRATQ